MAASSDRQRVAVIGGGIAGIASAWLLSKKHEVTLFEANDYVGGHTNTVEVTLDGKTAPVDTGFLVCNDLTYPNLLALFAELGVKLHPTNMTFGVSVAEDGIEWAGTDLSTVFAQPGNLFKPRFWGMIYDILRFNKNARGYLDQVRGSAATLGDLLDAEGYGTAFRQWYLLPMAGAIWSASHGDVLKFPAATFLRFCLNHHLLQINDRPQWRTVLGGGREYVQKMTPAIADVRINSAVSKVVRQGEKVIVTSPSGEEEFDAVVLACHAPEALAMLADASLPEREILGAVRYQANKAYLHTDTTLLPRTRKVWSAWNYLAPRGQGDRHPVCVSYLLNDLQPLPFTTPLVLTLNPPAPPRQDQTIAVFDYDHPQFDTPANIAQQRLPAIQGLNRAWFAGAWTRYGFHEDGLRSALKVARDFDCLPAWAKLDD